MLRILAKDSGDGEGGGSLVITQVRDLDDLVRMVKVKSSEI